MGRLGSFLGCLDAVLGVWERAFGDLGLSWIPQETPGATKELPGESPRTSGVLPRAPKSSRGAPGSPQEPPRAPGSRWETGVPAPKKPSAPLDLRTAGLHEPWGTPLRAEGTVADLQNNARFLKKTTNIELMHDGTTANERTNFQLLAHFANVRYQTQRHMKIAVRSFVVRQMMAWCLSTNVKFPYTSSSDQRSGTILKRFISSVEKQFNNVEEKETAVRKRAASR